MPNKDLNSKVYTVPDKVYNKIKQGLKTVDINDKQGKGVKRAKDIVNNREVSYSQMNRLKNYFTNNDNNDNEFKLIGGKVTKNWVEDTLKQDTESIKKEKKVKMDGGLENQFIKTHEKDNDNANPTNPDGGLIDVTKGSTFDKVMTGDEVYKSSDRKNEAYNREIKSIKYLIEYMSK
jgi:hypothetical protein